MEKTNCGKVTVCTLFSSICDFLYLNNLKKLYKYRVKNNYPKDEVMEVIQEIETIELLNLMKGLN